VKYSHFELLAFVLGGLAIVGSVFMAPSVTPQAAEVTAQLLLIIVLGGALHWGRNGGFLTALLAIALYVVMRYPLLESQGLSSDLLAMLGARSAMYAVTGIVGGEVAQRVKYLFARFEDEALVDPQTGAYSARYASEAILSGLGQWDRYQTEFSLVTIAFDPAVFGSVKARRLHHLLRQTAGHIRSDIRMVDDLAFSQPRTFLILLPRTPLQGARVVAERMAPSVAQVMGVSAEAITVSALAASHAADELRQLALSLVPRSSTADTEDDRRGVATESAQEPVA
jgi:GGDEF domain-containing protein